MRERSPQYRDHHDHVKQRHELAIGGNRTRRVDTQRADDGTDQVPDLRVSVVSAIGATELRLRNETDGDEFRHLLDADPACVSEYRDREVAAHHPERRMRT